jgi:hypothetical protein
MIPTTPNQDMYTRFSCPNPDCLQDIGPVLSPLSIAPGQASRSNGCGVPSVGARVVFQICTLAALYAILASSREGGHDDTHPCALPPLS